MPDAAPGRFFHFSFPIFVVAKNGSRPRLHELRDGDAFSELMSVLCALGWSYGGVLLNHDHPEPAPDIGEFSPDDLIVLTTRPPLDETGSRKPIQCSGSAVERAILEALRPVFAHCSRKVVQLDPLLARPLPEPVKARVKFYIYQQRQHGLGARYDSFSNPYAERSRDRKTQSVVSLKTTAAYLVRTRIGEHGPTLLNAFGMDGVTTLAWCHLLRTRFPHLLAAPRVVMAELTADPFPERPASLAFTESWPVRLLLDQPLEVG